MMRLIVRVKKNCQIDGLIDDDTARWYMRREIAHIGRPWRSVPGRMGAVTERARRRWMARVARLDTLPPSAK